MNKFIAVLLILSICMTNFVAIVYADDGYSKDQPLNYTKMAEACKEAKKGRLYVDGKLVDSDICPICPTKYLKSVLLPVRTILEQMGADSIIWTGDKRIVSFNYHGIKYEVYLYENKYLDESVSIDNISIFDRTHKRICNGEEVPYRIKLNPMAGIGLSIIIGDRLYLSQKTTNYLTDYFGYEMKVNLDDNAVSLTKNDKKFDPMVGVI